MDISVGIFCLTVCGFLFDRALCFVHLPENRITQESSSLLNNTSVAKAPLFKDEHLSKWDTSGYMLKTSDEAISDSLIQRERERVRSNLVNPVWPSGSYALPMSDTGCPEGNGFTWYTGHRTEELENEENRNEHSTSIHLKAKVGKPDITRYFCVKNTTETDEGRPKWPDGKYCIYKKGHFCPQGFHEGYVFWDDSNGDSGSNRNSKSGQLPEGLYNRDTLIYFCCKTTGSVMKQVSLPVNKPFYLLAFESSTCQEVHGAVYSLEYIVFDTENTNNGDARVYPYPYGADLKEPKIYYCYYRDCRWNFTHPSGTFSTPYFPQNYHDFQDCQWNITVPKSHVIQLQFEVFELESNPYSCGNDKCRCDYVEIKEESVTGDVTALGRYCMTNVPLNVIQSSTNKLIVMFHSDHAISAKGFNASYKAVLATKDRSATTTSSILASSKNLRSLRRISTTQYPTSGTEGKHLSTRASFITGEYANKNEGMATESSTKRPSSMSAELSKSSQAIVLASHSAGSFNKPLTREQERWTSRKPTNTKAEVTSTEVAHHHEGQSSGVLEPTSRGIMDLPLKYIIIAFGAFVVMVIVVLYLTCKLYKRRNRSFIKGTQQSNVFQSVIYSSMTNSSGSSAPSIKIYGDSELNEQFLEEKLIENPIYHKRNMWLDEQKSKDSDKPPWEIREEVKNLLLSDNPLYESYDRSNNEETRTENPLYEQHIRQ